MVILRSFTVERRLLSLTDLRESTGLAKATLHRLHADLQGAGLLEKIGVRYRLSRLVFELGLRASVERSRIEVATPTARGRASRCAPR